jgi:hypothetical protein
MEIGQLLVHKKGGIYKFLGNIRSANNGDDNALYLHIYPNQVGFWHRNYKEFNQVDRFRPVTEEEVIALIGLDAWTKACNIPVFSVLDETV